MHNCYFYREPTVENNQFSKYHILTQIKSGISFLFSFYRETTFKINQFFKFIQTLISNSYLRSVKSI